MTPAELQATREAIGWSRAQLAARTGRSATHVAQMEAAAGQRAISVDTAVAGYVTAVLAAIEAIPRPVTLDRRRVA